MEMPSEIVLAKGQVERVGRSDARLTHLAVGKPPLTRTFAALSHQEAIEVALSTLLDPKVGAVKEKSDIDAVGHRVVHGGERCIGSVPITPQVMKVLEDYYDLAPLHNPPNVQGIRACQELMPDVPMAAVFDSSLHQTVPPEAYIYAIPYEFYEKYRVRRYGFHGITFRYMTERVAQLMKRPLEDLKIVNLMLGSGTTACAFDRGRSVDVSTGLTPTEGLIQSTRCGDIDPLVITYLMRKEGLSPDQMDQMLNKTSGWQGISGVSSDLREVFAEAAAGNGRAQLAIDAFVYRCRKYVGAYAAAMGGVDAVVVSGGVGERAPQVREKILSGLEFMGIWVDSARNADGHPERRISPPEAKAEVWVIPTNEELVIARDTYNLVVKGLGSDAAS